MGAGKLTPETSNPIATNALAKPCGGQRSVGAGWRKDPGDVVLIGIS
jgi:hypothetical protein